MLVRWWLEFTPFLVLVECRNPEGVGVGSVSCSMRDSLRVVVQL